jgi:HAD superfamily hydrolase (TIGR01509 family)
MAAIKNIIFDLGGVLLNIDYNKTITAFKALGVENIEQMYGQHHATELFKKLETGAIGEKEFYESIRKYIPTAVSDQQIAHAWNALILDFRTDSLAELERLAKNYRLFLLSNTNSIHLRRFRKIFAEETGKPLLDDYFSKSWYSNLIGLRKPDKEAYEFVLADESLDPAETFFIDDTKENIETAVNMGIRSHLLLPGERIENLHL